MEATTTGCDQADHDGDVELATMPSCFELSRIHPTVLVQGPARTFLEKFTTLCFCQGGSAAN